MPELRVRVPLRAARGLLPGARDRVRRLRPRLPRARRRSRRVRADRLPGRGPARPRRRRGARALGPAPIEVVREWGVRKLGPAARDPDEGGHREAGDRGLLPRVRRRRRDAGRADSADDERSRGRPYGPFGDNDGTDISGARSRLTGDRRLAVLAEERRPGEELAAVLAERPGDHDARLARRGHAEHPSRHAAEHDLAPSRARRPRTRRGSRSRPRRPPATAPQRPTAPACSGSRPATGPAWIPSPSPSARIPQTKHSRNDGCPIPTWRVARVRGLRDGDTGGGGSSSTGAGRASATSGVAVEQHARARRRAHGERALEREAAGAASPRPRRRVDERGEAPAA